MVPRFDRLTEEQRDELLSAYLDDQLDAGDRARLEAQLAVDPALRAELEALRHTVALVHEMPQQPVPRNFILPQATVVASRPVPAARPQRRWLAPFLTAATAAVSLLFIAVLAGDLFFSGVGGVMQLAAPAPEEDRAAMAPSPVNGTGGEDEAEKMLSVTESPAEEAPAEVPPRIGVEGTQVPNAEAPPNPSLQPTPMPEAPGETQEAGDGEGSYAEQTPEAEGTHAPAAAGGGGEPTMEPPAPTPTPTTSKAADAVASTEAPEPEESVPEPIPLPSTSEPSERVVGGTESVPDDEAETGPPPAEGGGEDWQRPPLPIWSAPWRAIEVALGVAALLLALAMVWAWRARRR